MEQTVKRKTVLSLFLVAGLVALAPAAHGQITCSASGVAGDYALLDHGQIIGVGPRDATARLTFSAAGTTSGPVTANLNGVASHATLSGTFTVNPDCTGTWNFQEFDLSGNLLFTVTSDILWFEGMKANYFIFTSAKTANGSNLPNVISGTMEKLGGQNQ
jgi:hypothetical protein